MADKDAQEPSLELPSLSFGRKRRRKQEPAETAPVPPETAPVSPETALVPPETAPIPPKAAPVAGTRAATTTQPSPTGASRAVGQTEDVARQDPVTEPDRTARRRFSLPVLGGFAASLVTGALIGILTVGLTWAGFRLCEVVQGTSSCGDPGFLLLLAIVIAMAALGAALLDAWSVAEPRSTSALAVGLLAVVTLLLLVDVLFSSWMILVIPLIAMATFAVAHWVTTAAIEVTDA